MFVRLGARVHREIGGSTLGSAIFNHAVCFA